MYCRYDIKEIKNAHPEPGVHPDRSGAAVEKPFVTFPVDSVNEMMFNSGAQYAALEMQIVSKKHRSAVSGSLLRIISDNENN